MGTPIDDLPEVPPSIAGQFCGNYWGIGKPFGNVQTAKRIYVIFSGVDKGPNWTPLIAVPPDGLYHADQISGIPCQFEINVSGLVGKITFFSSHFRVTVIQSFVNDMFTGLTDSLDGVFVRNTANFYGVNGSATLIIPEII